MTDDSTVLVANRGEIAARVLRTAHALGLRTVAVYSDPDADAPHVRAADEAVRIGPAAVSSSYLSVDAILAAAQATGARFIHPGYGFLSERAAFAEAVEASGRVFVGPPASAIAAMGDKACAKSAMRQAGVPTVPGFDADNPSDAELLERAQALGVPLLVKAAAGGGGRGMRAVRDLAGLPAALASARREAQGAFGSGALLLERLIEDGRHVEVQIMADQHGRVVHLGERDCSVQRRHQKVIEEAPSPAVSPALRAEMGAAAVRAAQAVGYVGAGTVEFLLDASGQFYFLEMNTRLQVEHPVTELVTGLDLVELQLRVALGEPLPFTQEDVQLRGHAIEARLYAEEPAAGYAPRTGTLRAWSVPTGAGMRCDAGVRPGSTVSAHYDPMLAKLIASGPDRETARRRLTRMLDDTVVEGVTTNRAFLGRALRHPVFRGGNATTGFLDAHPELTAEPAPTEAQQAIAVAAHLARTAARGFRNSHRVPQTVALAVDGERTTVGLTARRQGLEIDGQGVSLRVDNAEKGGWGQLTRGGRVSRVHLWPDHSGTVVQLHGQRVRVGPWDPTPAPAQAAGGDGRICAPSAGTVVAVEVSVGQVVSPDTVVVVVEAMKLETALPAGVSGTVREVRAVVGQPAAAGAVLVVIEPESDDVQPSPEETP